MITKIEVQARSWTATGLKRRLWMKAVQAKAKATTMLPS